MSHYVWILAYPKSMCIVIWTRPGCVIKDVFRQPDHFLGSRDIFSLCPNSPPVYQSTLSDGSPFNFEYNLGLSLRVYSDGISCSPFDFEYILGLSLRVCLDGLSPSPFDFEHILDLLLR